MYLRLTFSFLNVPLEFCREFWNTFEKPIRLLKHCTGGLELCCNFYFWRHCSIIPICSIIPMLQHNFFWKFICSIIPTLQQKLNLRQNTRENLFALILVINVSIFFTCKIIVFDLAARIVNTSGAKIQFDTFSDSRVLY